MLSIFAVFVFCSFFGQRFDEEYSYTFLGYDDFTEFRKLTDDSRNKRTYKRADGQRIVTMNNQDTVIINYYWNNYSDDNDDESIWILDSIITDYYCCVCAESALDYYPINKGVYEKSYIQTGQNEWLDSKWISMATTDERNSKSYMLKKLTVIKNGKDEPCMTFKRTITVLTEGEFKLLKKKD